MTRALRIAALGLLLVACNADRVLAPSSSPDRPTPGVAQRASASATGGIIITEFLPDPNGTDSFGEWFELYNTGSTDVDLAGFTIGSFLADSHVIGRSVIVPAGKCIVIGNNADVTTNGGVTEAYSYPASGTGSIVLNNGGTSSSATDWIALRDASNAPVDSIAYGRYVFDATLNKYVAQDTLKGSWAVSAGVSFEVADVSASRTVVANNPNWVKSTTTYAPPAPGGQTLKGTPGTCPGGTVTPPPPAGPVETVTISPLATSASVGGTRQFTVIAKDANGIDATSTTTFTWTSSDPTIATITSAGLASGVAEGTTTITVTSANGKSASTTLTVTAPSAGSVSLSMNTPRELIIGYTKPIFPTVKDANGATITSPLVWSSSAPEIATVDQLGYVTGVAAGTAIIKATAPSGAFGSVSVQIDAPEATSAVYRNHVEFGTPTDADPSDDLILAKTQYVLSYNASRGGPNWVSWNLNGTQFGAAPRCDCFSADQSLPSSVYKVVDFDYRNGGYDRGHMVQSESRTTTLTENSSTFLLTNILPQGAENNQGPWSKLENALNDMVRTGGKEIYVVAGGIYSATPATLKNEGKVAVPDYTWKIAVILSAGQGLADVKSTADLQVIAVKMPNLVGTTGPASSVGIRNVPWETYKTTVDAIEAETGYDVLAALPDNIERVVESNDRPPVAAVTGATTGVEGSTLAFDASTSTDPDGDQLTYTWTFGDGTTGTGVSPTHVFADNGTFIVTVTAEDPAGATSTASLSVTVSNVAPTAAISAPSSVIEGSSFTISLTGVADPSSTDLASLTYAFDCGDGLGFGTASATTSASCATTDDASRTVRARVSDKDGGASEYSATVTVTNAAPVITALTVPAVPTSVGVQATANVTFTDVGTGDTHDATIAWGDGQSSTVNAGSALEASATHSYAKAGFYTVTVTVRDDDGGSATTRSSILVVYDAAAGSINGSGWIPGASKTDKTSFGIDVRYAGGSVPTGTFQLTAQNGALSLTSTTFAWLVVESPIATFRGTGTLSNGTAVEYQVTARDGGITGDKIDRMRFRVWNLATGVVLFDSEPTATEYAAPSVDLGGGNVTLH
jgi:DNA/RNA endonuclease G (NUC1)